LNRPPEGLGLQPRLGRPGPDVRGAWTRYLSAELADKWRRGRPHVLFVLDPGHGVGEEFGELALALLERPWPPVGAIELEQVKGVEDHIASWAPLWSLSKIAKPFPVASYGFPVDHRLSRPKGCDGLTDAGIALGPIEAAT
jgi:hypothetical protein